MKHTTRAARFLYEHGSSRVETVCDVIDREDGEGGIYVIFTEKRKPKPQVSITNSIEDAANTFIEFQGINPNRITWLERYDDHPDYLDQVHFAHYEADRRSKKLSDPSWTRLDQKVADGIIALIDAQ